MSYRIDLHTHSDGSPDGGLRLDDYRRMLQSGLDYIAITDHDTISSARLIHDELGNQIIIGEEITTLDGEIIGLFLSDAVPAGLSAAETVTRIRQQGGLVYVPHPFETVRRGLPIAVLKQIAANIDIIEIRNGRAVFQNHSGRARSAAQQFSLAGAASSDAHGAIGWGRTYSVIAEKPTSHNLVSLLQTATHQVKTVGAGIVYPKLNRLRKSRG